MTVLWLCSLWRLADLEILSNLGADGTDCFDGCWRQRSLQGCQFPLRLTINSWLKVEQLPHTHTHTHTHQTHSHRAHPVFLGGDVTLVSLLPYVTAATWKARKMEGLDGGETQASGHHRADLVKKKAKGEGKRWILERNALRWLDGSCSEETHEQECQVEDHRFNQQKGDALVLGRFLFNVCWAN